MNGEIPRTVGAALAAVSLILHASSALACGELKDPFLAPPPDPCAPNCGSTWNEYDPESGGGLHILQGFTTTAARTNDTCAAAIEMDPRVRIVSISLVNNETGEPIPGFKDFALNARMTRRLTRSSASGHVYWGFTTKIYKDVRPDTPARFEIRYTVPKHFRFLTRVGVATLFAQANLVSGKATNGDDTRFKEHVTLTDLGVLHVCTTPLDPKTGQCH